MDNYMWKNETRTFLHTILYKSKFKRYWSPKCYNWKHKSPRRELRILFDINPINAFLGLPPKAKGNKKANMNE